MKKKTIKPIYIGLFMLVCMLVLATVCYFVPQEIYIGDAVIRTPQLADVLDLSDSTEVEEPTQPDAIIVLESLADEEPYPYEKPKTAPFVPALPTAKPAVTQNKTEVAPAPVSDSDSESDSESDSDDETTTDIDTRTYLASFYAALQDDDQQYVRVVHYGDSQIEEDRLTAQLRRELQTRYGGGGVGLLPLHQTIPTYTIWQRITMNGSVQSINGGPKRYLVYGPKSTHRANDKYGVMGQVAVMDNRLVAGSEDITMTIKGYNKAPQTESYFNSIRVLTSGNIQVTIDKATSQEDNIFYLPDSTTSATIHLRGRGDVYGISLEDDYGIMVDNIPMRGCSGAIFTGMTAKEMTSYYKATNTRLIILQYGGNVMPYTTSKKQVQSYVENMQRQVQYIKYLVPQSSVLFVGPSDMCERRNGQLQTYRMIPEMDRALRQMAMEEEIGYFSLFEAMGGKGSMIRWHDQGLAGGDYVHFTRKGAEKAGKILANWLLKN